VTTEVLAAANMKITTCVMLARVVLMMEAGSKIPNDSRLQVRGSCEHVNESLVDKMFGVS
jgi:hypothetical protein